MLVRQLHSKPRYFGAVASAVVLYTLLCLSTALADSQQKWTPYFPRSATHKAAELAVLEEDDAKTPEFISTRNPTRPPRGLAAVAKSPARGPDGKLLFYGPRLLEAETVKVKTGHTSFGRPERRRRALEINKDYTLGDYPSSLSTANITSTGASSFNGEWSTLIPRSDKIKDFLDALQYPFAHYILEARPTTIKIRATSTQGQLNITLPDNLLTVNIAMAIDQDDKRVNLPTILGPWTGHGFYDNKRFVVIAKGISGTVYCVASVFSNDPENKSSEEPIMLMRLTLDGKYIRKVLHSNIWLKKVADLPN